VWRASVENPVSASFPTTKAALRALSRHGGGSDIDVPAAAAPAKPSSAADQGKSGIRWRPAHPGGCSSAVPSGSKTMRPPANRRQAQSISLQRVHEGVAPYRVDGGALRAPSTHFNACTLTLARFGTLDDHPDAQTKYCLEKLPR
jgi:hypothetical protein